MREREREKERRESLKSGNQGWLQLQLDHHRDGIFLETGHSNVLTTLIMQSL